MTDSARRVLVIGYGNPGRLDDGLGPALAEELAALDLPGVTIDSNYQLSVEDAEAISRYDAVVFVDAHTSIDAPFSFTPVEPDGRGSFSNHSLTPGAIVSLARELFGATADAHVLAIRGYEFNEYGQQLSEEARVNLGAALEFLTSILPGGDSSFPPPQAGGESTTNAREDMTCKTENM